MEFPHTRMLVDALFFAEATSFEARDSAQWARLLGLVHLYSMTGIHLYAFLDLVERAAARVGESVGLRASLARRSALALSTLLWVCLWGAQGYRPGMLKPLALVALRTWGRAMGIRFAPLAPLVIAVAFASLLFGLNLGTLIYFLAVAGGVMGRSHLKMAIYSWLAVVPVDLVEHRGVALFTPVWSLLSIPLVTGLVIPAWIGEFLGADVTYAWQATEISLSWLLRAAEIPGNLWHCPIWATAIGGAGALTVALIGGRRVMLACLGATALIGGVTRWAPFELGATPREVIQLNVRQGDAALLVGPGRAGSVIDTGPPRVLGRSAWLERFLHYGVLELRGVMLTHGDADHRGGYAALRRVIRVAGPYPYPAARRCGGTGGNRQMLGTVVPIPGGAYVNLGDSNARQERAFLPYLREELSKAPRCTVLKVSHHGSKTSSTPELLNLCAGAEAWISAGAHNPYGHPHPDVMRRLRAAGLRVRSTVDGDLLR